MRGFSSEYPEWCSLTADYLENPRMREKDVNEARKSMSKAEFEQEYMASFTVFEGQIYEFKDEYIKEFVHTDGCEYIAGLDPGYRDPTALVIIAYNPVTEVFHVIEEYLESGITTNVHAEAFKAMLEKNSVEVLFIDSAAAQFAADLAYTYDIASINAKKDVLPGIAYVQSLVDTGRLLVSAECTHTLQMLDQYHWDKNPALIKEKPAHTIESHIADAVRYALYSFSL